MYTYPNFENEIIDIFSDIIEQFSLEIISLSNDNFSTLKLENDKCEIKFTYNMGEVGCLFIDPKHPDKLYPIYSVWSYLFPNDKKKYGLHDFDFITQVYWLSALIKERLVNVLRGDFSWSRDYATNNLDLSKSFEFIMNMLDNEHPIKKKFWLGDVSWQSDLEKYLLEKGISL